ncbi:hypothetical protein CASFOL_028463 [Castilleja foliolosa]|uniref:Uncharacterized protein n=1 Tax=Castilleja foliolosa TaxID=1961234 RepID=A0ABD3CE89_9LAMI
MFAPLLIIIYRRATSSSRSTVVTIAHSVREIPRTLNFEIGPAIGNIFSKLQDLASSISEGVSF